MQFVLLGIVGKPSAGKSTFLNAVSMADAKVGDYPFTTIDPNKAVGQLAIPCVCQTHGVTCSPRTGSCEDGTRLVPIQLLDVAGLVPGAHEGKGMGNKFLDDLRRADALIHVVDLSGTLNAEGVPLSNKETWDVEQDIRFLENEIDHWLFNIINSDFDRLARKQEAEKKNFASTLALKLSGLKVTEDDIQHALKETGLDPTKPTKWSEDELFKLSVAIRTKSFPIVLAGNKIDHPNAEKNLKALKEKGYDVIPCSGLAEYVLRTYHEKGVITYIPGQSSFEWNTELKKTLSEKEIKTLEMIKQNILEKYGGTGIQKVLSHIVFDVLKLIPVYPVEDVTHLTDKDGRILPDVFLVPKGTTPRKFAGLIHTDLEKHYIHAMLAPSGRRIGEDYELQPYDIIKIVAAV